MHLQQRFLVTFVVLLLLVGCGGRDPESEPQLPSASLAPAATQTAVEPTAPSATATPVPPTAAPTDTAVPEPTATAVPPTDTPEPTAAPTEEPVADEPADVPELVWLPYSYGSYGEPILTMNDGIVAYAPEPTPIEVFFDYSPVSGQIAYGSLFFYGAANEQDSVTDLWVYDYATGTNTQWLEGEVGRAAWAPVANENGQPQLAVAIHNGETFDLHLMTAPFESEIIREDIQPYFSWSPDGQRMAYVVEEGWLMESPAYAGPRVEVAMPEPVYQDGGWVGDAPVWDNERFYLIYADNPFTFADLQTGEIFTPVQLDGTPLQETRPTKMLWAVELRHLVTQVEDFSQNVQIYLLSEDLSTVLDIYFLENSHLVGWYEEGESIIVLDINQEPQIWSLSEYQYITPE